MPAPLTPQPDAPDRDITIDFAIAVAHLRQLGISIRHSPTSGKVAVWNEHTRTVYLHPAATLWQKLFVLSDLFALHTRPGHISPSDPSPRLAMAPPLDRADLTEQSGANGTSARHPNLQAPHRTHPHRVLSPA